MNPPSHLEIGPTGNAAYLTSVFPVVLRRQAAIWMRFRVSTVMDLMTMAAQASVFFFIGRAAGQGEGWTANYAGFLVVGMIMNAILESSLTGPYSSIAQAYWEARLESYLLSPCPIGLLVLADVAWSYTRAAINAVLIGIIGYSFGARLDVSVVDLGTAVLVTIVAAIAVLGFGFLSAAMFMLLNAKGFNDPVAWLIGVLQGLVAGAYFPISELPGPLRTVAMALPQTYAIDAVRRLLGVADGREALIEAPGLSPLQWDVVILAVSAVVIGATGLWVFTLGMRKAQRDGGLSRWV